MRIPKIGLIVGLAILLAAGAVSGTVAATEPEQDITRTELLERWDALQQKRHELQTELRQVTREIRDLSRDLWQSSSRRSEAPFNIELPTDDDGATGEGHTYRANIPSQEELDAWRDDVRQNAERIKERVMERWQDYSGDILEWTPPAMIGYIAERTGMTPDEVREIIREGAWEDLRPADNGDEVEEQGSTDEEATDEEADRI